MYDYDELNKIKKLQSDGNRPNIFLECGCCGHLHRADYMGDCRNDDERYTFDQLDEMGEAVILYILDDEGEYYDRQEWER